MSSPVLPVYTNEFTDMKQVPYHQPASVPASPRALSREPDYDNYRYSPAGMVLNSVALLASSFLFFVFVAVLSKAHQYDQVQNAAFTFGLIGCFMQAVFSACSFSKFFMIHDGFKFIRSFMRAFLAFCYTVLFCFTVGFGTGIGVLVGLLAPFVGAFAYFIFYTNENNEKVLSRTYIRIN